MFDLIFEYIILLIACVIVVAFVGVIIMLPISIYNDSLHKDPNYNKPSVNISIDDNYKVDSKDVYIDDGFGGGYYISKDIYFIEDNITHDIYKTYDLSLFNTLKRGGVFNVRAENFIIYGMTINN